MIKIACNTAEEIANVVNHNSDVFVKVLKNHGRKIKNQNEKIESLAKEVEELKRAKGD